jgi:hypothetical protein
MSENVDKERVDGQNDCRMGERTAKFTFRSTLALFAFINRRQQWGVHPQNRASLFDGNPSFLANHGL